MKPIKTTRADPEIIRRLGLGAQQCVACGQVYSINNLPVDHCRNNTCPTNAEVLKSVDSDHFYLDGDLIDLIQMKWIANQDRDVWRNHEMHVALSTLRNYAQLLTGKRKGEIRLDAIRRAIKRFEEVKRMAHQRIKV